MISSLIFQISQQFYDPKNLCYVGVIATFEMQIYLSQNGRNQKDGSLVISLQSVVFGA